MILFIDDLRRNKWLSDLLVPYEKQFDNDDSIFSGDFLKWIDETDSQIIIRFERMPGRNYEYSCREVSYHIWYNNINDFMKIIMSDETFMMMKLTFS